MSYFHFTARSFWPLQPFSNREACADTWDRLRTRFPKVAACILMPNHIHLILDTSQPGQTQYDLSVELRAFTRRMYPGQRLWPTSPPPQAIHDAHHLRRQIRYVHLNPCRKGWIKDPLEWEWSTHRDAVGAAWPSWSDRDVLLRLWPARPAEFGATFHKYVSGDPSVSIEGTPAPRSQPPQGLVGFDAIVRATLAATRMGNSLNPMTRRLSVHVANRLAPTRRDLAATLLQLTPRRISQILAQPLDGAEREILGAVIRVLSDERLMKSTPGSKDSGGTFPFSGTNPFCLRVRT